MTESYVMPMEAHSVRLRYATQNFVGIQLVQWEPEVSVPECTENVPMVVLPPTRIPHFSLTHVWAKAKAGLAW